LTPSIKNACRQNIPFDRWTTCSRLRISDTLRKVSIERFMETLWPVSPRGSTGGPDKGEAEITDPAASPELISYRLSGTVCPGRPPK